MSEPVLTAHGVTIDRIVESQGPLYDPFTFFLGLTKETLAEHLGAAGEGIDAATGLVVLCMQSYVIRTPHHTILVDTCVGNHKDLPNPTWAMRRSEQYMTGLAALGLTVDDIDYVLCTHLHFDHVGWNTRLLDGRWVPTFPNARYVFQQAELDHWTGQASVPSCVTESVLPIVAAGQAELVGPDHGIGDHIRFDPTPGHTPHHVAILVGRAQTDAVLTGDVLHSPLQLALPDLSMRADSDPAQAATTRRRFLECWCESPALLCTTHFPVPSSGYVERHGAGFRLRAG